MRLTFALALLCLATPADARPRRSCPPGGCPAPVAAQPPVVQWYLSQPGPPRASAECEAFVAWLNGVRASRGLAPVLADPNLEAWAMRNNGVQRRRGLGHHVMGPARRQNAARGTVGQAEAMWAKNPLHQSALLDPTITRAGFAFDGAYSTYNAL